MSESLDRMMELCGFKRAEPNELYKNWNDYIAEVAGFSVGKRILSDKRRALIMIGIYHMFIEFLAGRLPDTLDEATDGYSYMSRAAIEFRDRFIASLQRQAEGDKVER